MKPTLQYTIISPNIKFCNEGDVALLCSSAEHILILLAEKIMNVDHTVGLKGRSRCLHLQYLRYVKSFAS